MHAKSVITKVTAMYIIPSVCRTHDLLSLAVGLSAPRISSYISKQIQFNYTDDSISTVPCLVAPHAPLHTVRMQSDCTVKAVITSAVLVAGSMEAMA